jgi:hypothetical protein
MSIQQNLGENIGSISNEKQLTHMHMTYQLRMHFTMLPIPYLSTGIWRNFLTIFPFYSTSVRFRSCYYTLYLFSICTFVKPPFYFFKTLNKVNF